MKNRVELGYSELSEELAKEGSQKLEEPIKNGSRSVKHEIDCVMHSLNYWIGLVGKPDDIKQADKAKQKILNRLIGRIRFALSMDLMGPFEENPVYLGVYPLKATIIRYVEHIVFNGNGEFSPNVHTNV